VRHWLGFAFALLAFATPLFWFMSTANDDPINNNVLRVMLVLFLLGVGQQAPRVYYKDRLVWLCVLLILILLVGYLWQRFSIPEDLFSGSKARVYIPTFCFFVVVAYGMNAAPRVSPFLLLITTGLGLLIHLLFLPTDTWLSGWQGNRLDFGLRNAQHAAVIFATALLAGTFFLPRALSLPLKIRVSAVPLLVGFILLMLFGVIATQTRAVWLGLLFSAIVLLLFHGTALLTGRYSLRWGTITKTAVIGIGITLAISSMLYFMDSNVTRRLSDEKIDVATIKEMAQPETLQYSSIGARIGLWSSAQEWIAERPVFGWGGRDIFKLQKHSLYFNEEYMKLLGHVHNSYLQTLVNVGAVALICMIAIAFLIGWRVVMTWREGQMPTDVFLFSCAFFSFWVTVNMFEPYIMNAAGFLINAVIGSFVYSWHLRRQHSPLCPLSFSHTHPEQE